MIISKETFREIKDPNSKLDIIFDIISDPDRQCKNLVKLEEEVDGLKRKAAKWGGVGGIITAVAAYLASMFIGHIAK